MKHLARWLTTPALLLLVAACSGSNNGPAAPAPPAPSAAPLNTLPGGISQRSVTTYPATTVGNGATAGFQDLLTGGLGRSGLALAAPDYANPLAPSALELRRNALHSNYRGLVDTTAAGGYGTLYGPNLAADGSDTLGEGLVPGKEYIGVLDDGSGRKQVVMAVQIPTSFDTESPCIVAGPSSGSRGVYGAIGAAGEWGLKRGCAIALTDAGKGVGLYDLADDSVNRIDGTRASRSEAGSDSFFAPDISEAERIAFNAATPNRLAVKHAHSGQNPEKDWGRDTLASIRYALYALNEEFSELAPSGAGRLVRFTAENTRVIAASVSNGGAAVLRAAEQDSEGLIDGVVASEPNAQPAAPASPGGAYGVRFNGTDLATVGRPLLDYFTFGSLYQPCAALATSAGLAEASVYNYLALTSLEPVAANRCAALASRGLVDGTTLQDQADDALARLHAYGWTDEHDSMHNAHFALGNAAIIGMMYTNAYGRFSVLDNLCGVSAGYVDASGALTAPSAAQLATRAQSYAAGNGTVNGAPATVVVNDSVGGARSWLLATSPSTATMDFGLDTALCQRALVTGVDTVSGTPLTADSTPTRAQSDAVVAGLQEVLLSGQLQGKPTLIVAGRSDALLPVNHTGRAYTAFNQQVEGTSSAVRYVEVLHAQHFDGFLPFTGFDNRFVPLHVYFNQAMDAMDAHLRTGTALPPSQVVRAIPRGGQPGAAPALTAANLPAIAAEPVAADRITMETGNVLAVPQ